MSVSKQNRPGVGVDAAGGAVIDPTQNVLDLVQAAIQRQDDLRAKDKEIADARAEHLKEIADLRSHHAEAERLSARDLSAAESRRVDAIALAESRRIDALLAASANAVALATTRAELTAAALAERVDTSAKTLATAVETTAKTLAVTVEATAKTLSERIVPLEQARYEGKGKQALADPALMELVSEVKALRTADSTRTGFDAGKAAAIAGAGLLGGGGIAALIMTLMKG